MSHYAHLLSVGTRAPGAPAPPLSAVLRPGKRSDNSDCANVPHCITLNPCQPQCSATAIPARVLPGLQAGAELSCGALVSLLRAAPWRAQERGLLGGRAPSSAPLLNERTQPWIMRRETGHVTRTSNTKIKSHLARSLFKVSDVMKAERDQALCPLIPDSKRTVPQSLSAGNRDNFQNKSRIRRTQHLLWSGRPSLCLCTRSPSSTGWC